MRRSIALAWICLAGSLGCDSGESDASTVESNPESAEPTTTKPPVGTWVVIDEQYGLFKTANPEAGRITAGAQLRVVGVVANEGDLLEVRTMAGDRGDVCARVVDLQPSYQLRFFVEPKAVQRVLTRTMRTEFEDGTSVELDPGVPVIETGAPGKVRLGSANLLVDIGEADVGRWFVPSSSVEPTVQPPVLTLKPGKKLLRYGERGFMAESAPFLAVREQNHDTGLLTFVNACGRFVLRPESPSSGVYRLDGPASAIPREGVVGVIAQQDVEFLHAPDSWDDGEDDDEIWGDGCSSVVRKAAAGTELTWLNGGSAGVVRTTHEIPRKAKQLDDRVCFDVSGLAVCIAAAQLTTETNLRCDLAGLPTNGSLPSNPQGPRVTLAKAEIGKGLDPDITRRIVRAHMNELRSCYSTGLGKDPTLAGRVVIAFEVTATGKVASASVKSTKLVPADERVPTCIATAFKRWTFPRPTTGKTVKVTYPIELSP